MEDQKVEALLKQAEEIKARRKDIRNKSETNKLKVKRTATSFSKLTKNQKIFIAILFASLLGPYIYLLLSKNFVPSEEVKQSGHYLSLLFATALSLSVVVAAFKGKIPKTRGKKINKLIGLISIPLTPFIIYGWFWLNFAVVIPKTVNDALGTPVTEVVIAKKWSTTSRYTCDFNLRLKPYASFYFGFCLSESAYEKLPEKEFPVKVHWIESLWGKSLQSVELNELYRANK